MYENEIQYIRETVKPVELAECMIDNLYNSQAGDKLFREYQDSISRQAVSCIWNELRNLGYVEEIEFERLVSPKYYNFSNDSIDVKVTFSDANIRNIRTMIQEHKDEWKEFIKSRYTSRDGFISYHSNDIEDDEWDLENALNGSHNAGTVLEFLCQENNISAETLFDWCVSEASLDIELLKKECIEEGWYEPKSICKEWFQSLLPRLRKNYKFRKLRGSVSVPPQYILETPKQRYIFTVYKDEFPDNSPFLIKRFFGRFVFAKLKEEKKKE